MMFVTFKDFWVSVFSNTSIKLHSLWIRSDSRNISFIRAARPQPRPIAWDQKFAPSSGCHSWLAARWRRPTLRVHVSPQQSHSHLSDRHQLTTLLTPSFANTQVVPSDSAPVYSVRAVSFIYCFYNSQHSFFSSKNKCQTAYQFFTIGNVLYFLWIFFTKKCAFLFSCMHKYHNMKCGMEICCLFHILCVCVAQNTCTIPETRPLLTRLNRAPWGGCRHGRGKPQHQHELAGKNLHAWEHYHARLLEPRRTVPWCRQGGAGLGWAVGAGLAGKDQGKRWSCCCGCFLSDNSRRGETLKGMRSDMNICACAGVLFPWCVQMWRRGCVPQVSFVCEKFSAIYLGKLLTFLSDSLWF